MKKTIYLLIVGMLTSGMHAASNSSNHKHLAEDKEFQRRQMQYLANTIDRAAICVQLGICSCHCDDLASKGKIFIGSCVAVVLCHFGLIAVINSNNKQSTVDSKSYKN